jgi:hypothetical protein
LHPVSRRAVSSGKPTAAVSSVLAPRRHDPVRSPELDLARASKRDSRRRQFSLPKYRAERRRSGRARASLNAGVLSRATGGLWLVSGHRVVVIRLTYPRQQKRPCFVNNSSCAWPRRAPTPFRQVSRATPVAFTRLLMSVGQATSSLSERANAKGRILRWAVGSGSVVEQAANERIKTMPLPKGIHPEALELLQEHDWPWDD